MPDINFLAVFVSAVAAFILSSIWYTCFAAQLSKDGNADKSSRPPLWKIGVELARSLIVASVLAGIALQCDVTGWTGGLLLALSLWVAFPVVLWTGAMVWEGTSPKVAAVHAGDWLVKLLAITAVLLLVGCHGPTKQTGVPMLQDDFSVTRTGDRGNDVSNLRGRSGRGV